MPAESTIQFQGDLELIGFSDVIQFLAGGRKTGALIVDRSDGVERHIYFDKGEIVAASSSRPEDYLGQIPGVGHTGRPYCFRTATALALMPDPGRPWFSTMTPGVLVSCRT